MRHLGTPCGIGAKSAYGRSIVAGIGARGAPLVANVWQHMLV